MVSGGLLRALYVVVVVGMRIVNVIARGRQRRRAQRRRESGFGDSMF